MARVVSTEKRVGDAGQQTEIGIHSWVWCRTCVICHKHQGRNFMNHTLDRPCLMKTAGGMALATAAGTLRGAPAFAQQVPWSSGTGAPKLKAPASACACHM